MRKGVKSGPQDLPASELKAQAIQALKDFSKRNPLVEVAPCIKMIKE